MRRIVDPGFQVVGFWECSTGRTRSVVQVRLAVQSLRFRV